MNVQLEKIHCSLVDVAQLLCSYISSDVHIFTSMLVCYFRFGWELHNKTSFVREYASVGSVIAWKKHGKGTADNDKNPLIGGFVSQKYKCNSLIVQKDSFSSEAFENKIFAILVRTYEGGEVLRSMLNEMKSSLSLSLSFWRMLIGEFRTKFQKVNSIKRFSFRFIVRAKGKYKLFRTFSKTGPWLTIVVILLWLKVAVSMNVFSLSQY